MKRSIKNLKGGRKELMDFFEEFKFENMRNKSKKGRKKTASFIDKTANSITKTSKKLAKTLRINKLLKTSKNIGKRVLKKSTNIVKKSSHELIKKRPRKKINRKKTNRKKTNRKK